MDKEKISSLLEVGSEILNQVNGAVNSGNYSSLNSEIKNKLKDTIEKDITAKETVNRQADRRSEMQRKMSESMKKQQERNARMSMYGGRLRKTGEPQRPAKEEKVEVIRPKKKFEPTPFERRKVSKADGVAAIVGGAAISILTICFAFGALLIAAFVGGRIGTIVVGVMLAAALALGIVLIVRGIGRNALARRFREYAITAGNSNSYFSLSGRNLTIAANTPANTTGYSITITATDTTTGATKAATYTIKINKAK